MRRPVLLLSVLLAGVLVAVLLLFLGGEEGEQAGEGDAPPAAADRTLPQPSPAPPEPESGPAVADLLGLQGGRAGGSLTLVESEVGVLVRFNVRRLPAGRHGLYLRELGDCSAGDGSSAGGYLALGSGGGREAARLGEVTANVAGQARGSFTRQDLALESIVGRSVLVESEPEEGEGRLLACGVVRRR